MSIQSNKLLGQHAIVIGAGMGGLMAAGVLARYFTEVLVLDKDRLPEAAEPRMGVPQGTQAHALLVGGRRNIEKIFPGCMSELIDYGAITARYGLEFHIRDWLGWFPRRDIGLTGLFMTRPLLERTVRSCLLRNGRVTIRDGVNVTGWKHDGTRIAVTISGQAPQTLTADFVVDATGRGGQTKEMLEANGYGPVEEIVIDTGEAYASAYFEIPPGCKDSSHSFIIMGTPPVSHSSFLLAVEGNRWICALTGRFDEAPPKDPEGFIAFARNLSDPCIYDRISQAKPLGPIRAFKPAFSKWRHYERLAEIPDRIVPLGDAIAYVNPIYAQGMTLASTHAQCLWKALEARAGASLDGLTREYLNGAASFTQQIWSGLEVLEFAYPKTVGERPADVGQRIAYARALRRLAVEDAEVHGLMTRVNQLIEPASVLMRDDIRARVGAIMAKG